MKHYPVISANDLSIGYPKSRSHCTSVLYEHLSFDLFSGEVTSLLGSNGAGKSTLLRTLTGLQSSLQGEVILDGKDISQYSENELSTLIGLVLTDKTVSGGLTVFDLVALGRYPYTGFFGRLSKKDHSVIEQAMSDVDILFKRDTYVAELSDGERQKAMIAKVLAQECPIIILDEPTAFLDIVNRIEITTLLHKLAINNNKTILLSTHDVELALKLSDKLWLLSRDQGFVSGNTEDIVLSGAINQFLGRKNISFDNSTGTFSINQPEEYEVTLLAKDECLYWATNFLKRNHYNVKTYIDTEIPTVKIDNPNQIELAYKNQVYSLKSFADLRNMLFFIK